MAEGGLDRYLGLAPLETEEGGSVAVRPANLNLTAVLQLITSYRGTLAAEPPRLRPRLRYRQASLGFCCLRR